MDKLLITGGKRLAGELAVSGSKNAALPILAATLLTDDAMTIGNVPHLHDVTTMVGLLRRLGADVLMEDTMELVVSAGALQQFCAPYELVKTMRASFLVMGPLLARHGQSQVSLPGGCAIGARPVDQHLKGFEAMGARIDVRDGYVHAEAPHGLVGADIEMDMVTVGATENLLMAATLAHGTTVLRNAALEPEVVDLAECLIAMGADIRGHGTSTIEVRGAARLHGGRFSVMADRVEAGTYLIAAAATGGTVRLTDAPVGVLTAVLEVLEAAGAALSVDDRSLTLSMDGRPVPVDIVTEPYPGFPTDMQAQVMALNCLADGVSEVRETIFENRFMHVQELCRLGAQIDLHGASLARVTGVPKLYSAPVMATDLRASFSLVVAALAAEGTTLIDRIYHIDRGYECIEEKLASLGADVRRVAHAPAP